MCTCRRGGASASSPPDSGKRLGGDERRCPEEPKTTGQKQEAASVEAPR